jgi:Fanconi anemia group M protein
MRQTLNKVIEGFAKSLQREVMSSRLCLLTEQDRVFSNKFVAALKAICNAPLTWERVISVEKETKNTWVYDISLEEYFNFIAGKNGGMIAHNTAISFMLAAQRLQHFPQSKILVLAPTKPLAEQHLQTFKQHLPLPEDSYALFTGEVPPAKRCELWKTARLVFSTPQGLENDVLGEQVSLEDVSLMVFDEAHRATGEYSYNFIAKQYQRKARYPRILALTASPGSDATKIEEVCKNLFIEAVEIRTDADPDVQPYVQETETQWIKVPLPAEFLDVKKFLDNCIKSKLAMLRELGLNKQVDYYSKRELLALQGELHAKLAAGERDFETMKALSFAAEIMKAQHALELLESQGSTALCKYLEKLMVEAESSKVKAVKNLVKDLNFRSAFIKAQKLVEQGIEHPKLAIARGVVAREVAENKHAKILLFTQYRDSAVKLKEELQKAQSVVPALFVGQAKKGETGLSQKQQIELIEQFKDGLYNVLICTSVAEEGLDIPYVDLVVFYEPIPSAIRTIQRRGRTGRQDKGKVIVLMAQNTRDEGYRWSAHHKEKKMHRVLDQLRTSLRKRFADAHTPLHKFEQPEKPVLVFADYREKGTGVLKELVELGASLKLEMLQVADYVLSPRCAVEFKTVEDFAQSIIDGRLLEQLKQFKQSYERPVIIVEGTADLFSARNIHPNAIRGMLATIAVSYGIPVIYTKDTKDTAAQLVAIAKREQAVQKETWQPHAEKRAMSVQEQQEYIVSSLPNVGLQLAKELLQHFKSVKNIVNASEDHLKQVEGVGDKKAKAIKDAVEKEYPK